MMMPETLEMEALPPAVVAEILQKVEKKKSFWQKHHGLLKQVVIRKKKRGMSVMNSKSLVLLRSYAFSALICVNLILGLDWDFQQWHCPKLKKNLVLNWAPGAKGPLVRWQLEKIGSNPSLFTPSFHPAGFLSMGQICGSFITAGISDSIGRKATTLLSCLPVLIGWICLALANSSFLLILGRFLIGLGMGIEGSLHSLYVVELMPKKRRGPWVTSGVLTIVSGILLVYIMGTFLHWQVNEKTF